MLRKIWSILRDQQGGLLLETVVTLATFGILGTAVLGAVQGSMIAKRHFEIDSQVEIILRNQLAYVWEQNYKPPVDTYLSITPPPGYSVVAESMTWDASSTDISTVRITIYHQGQPVEVYETLRSNR